MDSKQSSYYRQEGPKSKTALRVFGRWFRIKCNIVAASKNIRGSRIENDAPPQQHAYMILAATAAQPTANYYCSPAIILLLLL
jgi:hypothetical protein